MSGREVLSPSKRHHTVVTKEKSKNVMIPFFLKQGDVEHSIPHIVPSFGFAQDPHY